MASLPFVVVLLLVVCPVLAFAQDQFRIFFADKGLSFLDLTPGSPRYEQALNRLSEETRTRRARSLGTQQILSEEDFNIPEGYLAQVELAGFEVLGSSKWTNTAVVRGNATDIEKLSRSVFIRSIQRLKRSVPRLAENAPSTLHLSSCGYDSVIYRAGPSRSQLARTNITPLHALGLDATGVRVAYFDTGFNWSFNDALEHSNVIDEYDFVFGDTVVSDQPGDVGGQGNHGTHVLTVAAGYLPDTVIGPAYNAELLLGKTEDLRSETPVEEENLARAFEWAEAQGARIASISLGYQNFDSGFVGYTYEDINGQNAISTRAAARAARLGMLVVVSAGNGRLSGFPHISPPSDADSILAVGAMDLNDSIATFSSIGPTFDGRIKPDIVAPGVGVISFAEGYGPVSVGGTSNAAPLVSGAAALMMQAHPDASGQEVREAILATGRLSKSPDNTYGWGMIDAYASAIELGTFIGKVTPTPLDNGLRVCAGVGSKNSANVKLLYEIDGARREFAMEETTDSNIYEGAFHADRSDVGKLVKYSIEVTDEQGAIARMPRNTQSHFEYILRAIPAPNTPVVQVLRSGTTIGLEFSGVKSGDYKIYDVLGRQIKTAEFSDSKLISVPTQDLIKGHYFIALHLQGHEMQVIKFQVFR